MLVTVDTGGTKTLVSSFGYDGQLDATARFLTPADPELYITTLRSTLKKQFNAATVEAIIIAVPGKVTNNIAVYCDHLGWENFDIAGRLDPDGSLLGDAPIWVENDANLAGLGETRLMSPMPISSLYVTISTGIGTGMITNGRIDPGLERSEGGHAQIEFRDKVQAWEDFAAGSAIYRDFGKFARDIDDEKDWQDIADRISRGFLMIIPLIQPDIIIIGGSMGTYFTRYQQYLQDILREDLPAFIPVPEFKEANHPEEAVLYGCYYYALDRLAHTKITG